MLVLKAAFVYTLWLMGGGSRLLPRALRHPPRTPQNTGVCPARRGRGFWMTAPENETQHMGWDLQLEVDIDKRLACRNIRGCVQFFLSRPWFGIHAKTSKPRQHR